MRTTLALAGECGRPVPCDWPPGCRCGRCRGSRDRPRRLSPELKATRGGVARGHTQGAVPTPCG